MSKLKVKISFKHLNEGTLAEFATSVCDKMQNNSHFKTPTPPIKEVQKATDAYSSSHTIAKEVTTKENTAIKNEKKAELTDLLSALAGYVNLASKGNEVALESSGFEMASSSSAPIGVLDAPAEIHAKDGNNSGEIEISFSKVAKATSYIILFTKDADQENAKWDAKLVTKTKNLVTGLEEGVKYFFKVCATSAKSSELDRYNYTDVVSRISQ
ncbi:MAG: hypothetical protein GQ570_10070 [Helicobacteraceae bacterium]|nr:hypothetical protein [Helicobacteraceae bacterium]